MELYNEIVNNVSNISEKIKENRIKVRKLRRIGTYEGYKKCIELCEESIKLIFDNELEKYKKSDIGSFYYMEAKCYKCLNNIDEAEKMINESLKYEIIELYITDTHWLLAECRILQGRIKEALDIYDECIEFYRNKMKYLDENDGSLIGLVSLISNKSILLEDEIMARNAIKLYINKHVEPLNENLLDELHNNLNKTLDKNDIR